MEKAGDQGIAPNDFILRGRLYNQWYVGSDNPRNIYISPVFASPEDLAFASLLMEAGVTVTVKKVTAAQHGFLVRRTEGHTEGDRVLFGTLKGYFAL